MKKMITTLAIAAASAAAAGALATPAQASTSLSGCQVSPQRIRSYGFDASGHKQVLLRTDIRCQTDRWVNLAQQGWEDDNRPGDRLDDRWFYKTQWVRVHPGITTHVDSVARLPHTPNDGAIEELYQRTNFRVRTVEQYPVTSTWRGWESTGLSYIHH